MANLTLDDVLNLAKLARLELTGEEAAKFRQEFNSILKYVEQLDAVDTSGLEPTSQVTGLSDVTRPDTVIDYGTTPKDLLKNVPHHEGSQIKVKRMVE